MTDNKTKKYVLKSISLIIVLITFFTNTTIVKAENTKSKGIKTEDKLVPNNNTKNIESKDYKIKAKVLGEDEEVSSSKLDIIDEQQNDNVITIVDNSDIKSDNKEIKDTIKEDFENSNYILIHGEDLENENIDNLIEPLGINTKIQVTPVDAEAKSIQNDLIAYGLSVNENGSLNCDAYYKVDDKTNLNKDENLIDDNLIDRVVDSLETKEKSFNTFIENDTVEPQQDLTNAIVRTNSLDFGTYGRIFVTTYLQREATNANVNGYSASIWDVKSSVTTTGGHSLYGPSWWQVDYLYTRISTQAYGAERVIDAGPNNTPRDGTASVGLDVSGPSIGWSYPCPEVGVTESTYYPYYGRWTHNFRRQSQSARGVFTARPGVRATNTVGAFAVDISNTVTFWDSQYNHGGTIDKGTGVWQYVVSDR